MKELFPLNTFQQDAVLKRLNELSDGVNAPSFEEIVDKDGHPRFIEGNIVIEEISGITQTYGKWSLSGTHLMLVIAFEIANGTAATAGNIMYQLELPKWIMDKLIPSSINTLDNKTFNAYASDATSQAFSTVLTKSNDKLNIYWGGLTATKDRAVRIVFDLLIDNA